MEALLAIYDDKVDKRLLIRRVNIAMLRLIPEAQALAARKAATGEGRE